MLHLQCSQKPPPLIYKYAAIFIIETIAYL